MFDSQEEILSGYLIFRLGLVYVLKLSFVYVIANKRFLYNFDSNGIKCIHDVHLLLRVDILTNMLIK